MSLVVPLSLDVFAQNLESKPKVVYVYDALCGWCYGFSPVIEKLYQKYAGGPEFEIVSGGMVVGEGVGPISEMATYIKTAYPIVEKTTGVKFGKAFVRGTLKKGTTVFSSEKPAVALARVKNLKPELSFAFAAAIQKAIYRDGLGPDEDETYRILAQKFGFDPEEFVREMKSPDALQAALNDFRYAENLGVNGYPTVLWVVDGKIETLCRGYCSYHILEAELKKRL
ncbi:MAG: DsbA family protein [Bacteroidia bacterium]|nr:DsbA family protein [Bacteroidia bacterium]